ncbi:MAG: K(+)-transporting ATPase subunit C [Clostridiales bacterium]|jgi:K+-transporting ATPase ATPase C chain|nr:K(+)-transporting ATPase subunit C [Clostridiales bacterium]
MKGFLKQFRPALMILFVMIIICGVVYTGVVTGIAQLVFPGQANGSIITVTLKDGTVKEYGSKLMAQEFSEAQYLIGRPMIVTNLSPVSTSQAELVQERVDWWHNFDPDNDADIPADLVTGSGSGVDPDISPEAAEYQVVRIARERNMTEDDVRAVIEKYTSGRFLGLIGEPCVNVLMVNLALDNLI